MMTTSGVSSSGKSGYVRHRDIKLSEKELKKERAVLQKTLEGWISTFFLEMYNQQISFFFHRCMCDLSRKTILEISV